MKLLRWSRLGAVGEVPESDAGCWFIIVASLSLLVGRIIGYRRTEKPDTASGLRSYKQKNVNTVRIFIIIVHLKFISEKNIFLLYPGYEPATNKKYVKTVRIFRRFNAIVSQLKMHYFSEGAFESLIASQLLKKEKYI